MPGDDSLTKTALIVLIVLFVLFAGLGFYYMTQLGGPDKPDTLIAKLEGERQAIRRLDQEMVEVDKAVAQKKKETTDVDWQLAVEQDQADRLRLARSNYQTMRDVRRGWVGALETIRRRVSDYLENGDPAELGGGYGYQPLSRRKDRQEQTNAQSISKLDSAIDEARNELTKANNRYTRRYEDKRNLRSRLETELDQAKDELQRASQREPIDLQVNVDGVVLATSLATRQVVVNIGEQHGVKRGMRFEVFRVRQAGRRVRKGFIEVRSLNRETANCMLLEQAVRLPRCPSCGYIAQMAEEACCPYCTGSGQGLHIQRLSASPKFVTLAMNPDDPIVIGDSVHNPFFEAGKSPRFAIKGDPLSSQYKTEDLLAAVRWHGGSVDAEIGAGTSVLLAGKWALDETKKARELGLQVLHHHEVFDFLRR